LEKLFQASLRAKGVLCIAENPTKNAQLALTKENKELWKRLKQSHFCAIAPLDFLLSFGSRYVLKQFSVKEATDKIGGDSIQEGEQ